LGKKGSGGWENGKDMEGWGVVRSTNHPLSNFTTSANIYDLTCFQPLLFFLTFWSSQLDFLQIADTFWIDWFQSIFSLFFSFTICNVWFCYSGSDVRLRGSFKFLVFVEAECFFWPNNVMTFLPDCESLRPFYNLPKDF